MCNYSGDWREVTVSRLPGDELHPLTLFLAANAVAHEPDVASAEKLILETISLGLISERIGHEKAKLNPEPYCPSSNPCEPNQSVGKFKSLPDNCDYCPIATNMKP
jgi:hypothetical protein